jgi:hypothetical protein
VAGTRAKGKRNMQQLSMYLVIRLDVQFDFLAGKGTDSKVNHRLAQARSPVPVTIDQPRRLQWFTHLINIFGFSSEMHLKDSKIKAISSC